MSSKLGHQLPCRRKSYLKCLRASPFRLTHAQSRFTGVFLRSPVDFPRSPIDFPKFHIDFQIHRLADILDSPMTRSSASGTLERVRLLLEVVGVWLSSKTKHFGRKPPKTTPLQLLRFIFDLLM